MPASLDLADFERVLAQIKANEEKWAKKGYVSPDYAKLSADALNRHTTPLLPRPSTAAKAPEGPHSAPFCVMRVS